MPARSLTTPALRRRGRVALGGLLGGAVLLSAPLVATAQDPGPILATTVAEAPEVEPGLTLRPEAWTLPVQDYRLTAGFGASSSLWSSDHTGLDFAAATGTPVRSVADGEVTFAGYDGALGTKVVVTLPDGTDVWYCHLDSTQVEVGEQVDGGQDLGSVGSSGNSTGPHLHLEVRPGGGDPVDPEEALAGHRVNP